MPSSHSLAGPFALLALAACGAPGPADDDAPLVLTAADVHVLGTSDSIAVVEDLAAADSARLIQGAVSRLEGTPEEHAAVLPQYVDFRCDDDGAMWLRPLDLDTGGLRGTAHWLRIDRDGGLREVRFPERFDPYRFTDGRVWRVVRDELDVASVGWVNAPSPIQRPS